VEILMVLAIIQARMGSSRLPGKTLKKISGKPLLEHVINRIKYSETIDEIMVATTTNPEDKAIISLAEQQDILTYSGSTDDVLDRVYKAAKKGKADIIVRVTADDPFKDPTIIDKIVKYFITNPKVDYVSNTIEPTYPIGIDVEVFSFSALEKAWKEAKSLLEREHVTPYIWDNQGLFNIASIKNRTDLSHLRWTIDTKEDIEMTRAVYKILYKEGEIFLMNDILKFIERYPHVPAINSHIEQNHLTNNSIKPGHYL